MIAEPTISYDDDSTIARGETDTIALPEPRLARDDAALLPAKLLWRVVAWYRVAGRYADAAALIEELELRSGPSGRAMDERAHLLLAMGETTAAIAQWEQRIAPAPTATARAALARAHLEAGDVAMAGAISSGLSLTDPELQTVQALAADVARANGDLATARAYHERVLAEMPDNLNALLALARIALLDHERETALALLDTIVEMIQQAATPAQLFAAATIAELCDRPTLATTLRYRGVRLEAMRTARLAHEIDLALGRVESVRPQPAPPAPLPVEAGAADGLIARLRAARADEPPDQGDPLPPVTETSTMAPVESTPIIQTEVAVEPRVAEILRREFGHEELRPGQAAVIANVLARRDTLAIMPTGAGKSLTFQLPAMLLEGTTLVLSPLIALMKDQVESLPELVRERTALVNSTLSPDEQRRVLDRLVDGEFKLVYAAPERLRQHAFLRALRAAGVALVVVDEAHCISLWGHDFRPDYLGIPAALPELGDPPLLAITATATPRMAEGIGAGLGRPLDLLRTSIFRPNLFYEAYRLANREAKIAKVIEICREERGPGIVYVSSRRDTETIAGLLRDRGVDAIPYHAGLDPETRARNQERFMSGQTRVVVATVAFGMGVDKKDVRFIVHLMAPRSLEAYSQESGRAGRDDQASRCVLLTTPTDRTTLARLAKRDELEIDILRRVYAGVKRQTVGRWATLDPETLLPPPAGEDDPDEPPDPRIALGLLQQADLVRRHPDAPLNYTLRYRDAVPSSDDAPLPAPLLLPLDPTSATDEGESAWERLVTWAGVRSGRGSVTIQTVEACNALGLSPIELSRLLGSRSDLIVREGPRLVCLEVPPAGVDAAARLASVLSRTHQDAQQRIAQVIAYATGGRCRHVMIANHLGEALAPCQTACDVCAGNKGGGRDQSRFPEPDEAPVRRSVLTASDALAVLQAVRTLPYPMGKTGLTRLLLGSVESRVRADRVRSFGALANVPKGKIETLIDRLLADDFLARDLDHEFKVITLTARGAAATLVDLADYEPRPLPLPAGRSPATGTSAAHTSEQLDAIGLALLDRLKVWRRDRAQRNNVPPYLVLHDKTLYEIALARPATLAALAIVSGIGPSKIERYGEEVLGIVAAD